jgi:hypothetical protein
VGKWTKRNVENDGLETSVEARETEGEEKGEGLARSLDVEMTSPLDLVMPAVA